MAIPTTCDTRRHLYEPEDGHRHGPDRVQLGWRGVLHVRNDIAHGMVVVFPRLAKNKSKLFCVYLYIHTYIAFDLYSHLSLSSKY